MNIADVYTLKVPDLARLERLGNKSAQNIKVSCEKSKDISFERVIFALGVRFVGETVAKKLAGAFKTIEQLEKASFEELIQVDEIGERIAQSVIGYFADERNIAILDRLKSHGLRMSLSEEQIELKSNLLDGKSVVISGTFKFNSREELS